MLSVFYVHNVIPGPQLFQNNLDLVYGLYIALILLNIIVMVFLLFSTNMLTKIIRIPTRFLGVMILILSFVGVYSLRNSLTDVMLSAGFGVLGLILKRLNLPIVPIILGMVLGGIMEVKLRSALPRLKTPFDMIDRPIAFILFVMILLVIALHIRTLIKEYRTHQPDEDHKLHDSQMR
jgi:putative tricarboxylic transport membrane protein